MVVLSADSVGVEWGKPQPPDEMSDEERRQYIDAPDLPTLVISGPFGKVRVFVPPQAAKVLGDNLDPLAVALANRTIDRLPWPFEAVEGERFFRVPVLRR